MITETGGPAFPSFESHLGYGQMLAVGGMTLRDYAAIKAMVALLAGKFPITKEIDAEQRIAVAAYQMADAMLKERQA
jgi:hypothetical protein